MQVDYVKYPQIPPGCQMNLNKKTGAFQVFREGKMRSPWCTTKRESIGRINKDGVFNLSKTYALQMQLHNMKPETPNPAVKEPAVTKVVEALSQVVSDTKLETRNPTFCTVPMNALVLGSLMQALTGDTDCVSIGDFIGRNKDFFKTYIPECKFDRVSHDTVRRCLMLIAPEKFESFYFSTIRPFVKLTVQRVVAADGQAVRATGKTTEEKPDLHGASLFMNFYDTSNRVCLGQRLIESKTNEITVGPEMVKCFDLKGAIVTADAMSCQVGFVETVYKVAEYLISLKGNQEKCWKEACYLFNTTHPDQVTTWESGWEMDHGRIERRTVSMISGRLLSKIIRDKWPGLSGGAIVRVLKESTKKQRTRPPTKSVFTSPLCRQNKTA